MSEKVEIDYKCPAASCGSTNVVMVYEDIYAVGNDEPMDAVRKGAECQGCGLRFWTPDLNDVDPGGEVDA